MLQDWFAFRRSFLFQLQFPQPLTNKLTATFMRLPEQLLVQSSMLLKAPKIVLHHHANFHISYECMWDFEMTDIHLFTVIFTQKVISWVHPSVSRVFSHVDTLLAICKSDDVHCLYWLDLRYEAKYLISNGREMVPLRLMVCFSNVVP